jgi:hypothetical protein
VLNVRHAASAVLLLLAISSPAFAQGTQSVTLTEPGVYTLKDLFTAADIVAIVRITSGDSEHYQSAVYKGEVIRSFKGVNAGQILYFGPFIGNRIGWEYVLFLRNSKQPLAPKTSDSPYGTVVYREVFDEGYSSMETNYECVFDGKEVAQQCDYGVRVCTDYIKLPKGTRTSPPLSETTSFGCRWVRKSVFEQLVQAFSK